MQYTIFQKCRLLFEKVHIALCIRGICLMAKESQLRIPPFAVRHPSGWQKTPLAGNLIEYYRKCIMRVSVAHVGVLCALGLLMYKATEGCLCGCNIRLWHKLYESQRNTKKLLTQHAVTMTTRQNHLA